MSSDESIAVTVDGKYARGWPQSREALGLNPASSYDTIEGFDVVNVQESDDGKFTESVTVKFENTGILRDVRDRLKEEIESLAAQGLYGEAEDIEDFLYSGLPEAWKYE